MLIDNGLGTRDIDEPGHDEVHAQIPHCTPGFRPYQTMMEVYRRQRLRNRACLYDLAGSACSLGSGALTIFCAHERRDLLELAD